MSKGISADWLKAIAMFTMLLDHIGAALFPEADWLRAVGRIAFPLFTWLLVEGFVHTSNLPRYLVNMGLFALLSEVPFDLALFGRLEPAYQNVFFTLFLDLVTLYLVKGIWDRQQEPGTEPGGETAGCPRRCSYGAFFLAVAAAMALAELWHTDYGSQGIVLAVVFYSYARAGRPGLWQGYLIFCLSYYLQPFFERMTLTNPGTWLRITDAMLFEGLGIFSVLLLRRYNGIRKWRKGKYFFYLFYPLHLLLLFAAVQMQKM